MPLSALDVLVTELDYGEQRLVMAVQGLSPAEMVWRAGPNTNSIAFNLWHTARIMDRYVHRRLQDREELWVLENWEQRLPIPTAGEGGVPVGTGNGYSDQQVSAFPALPAEDYLAYWRGVVAAVRRWLQQLPPERLEETPTQPGFQPDTTLNVLVLSLAHVHLHRGEIWNLRAAQGLKGLG